MPSTDYNEIEEAIREINNFSDSFKIREFVEGDKRNEVLNAAEKTISGLYGIKLGEMYQRWVLDCIVEMAYEVSKDFSRRVELYQSTKVASLLTDLQSATGFDKDFPNRETRLFLMKSIFGDPEHLGNNDNLSQFHNSRKQVLDTAANFALNFDLDGRPSLREAVDSALVPFISYLSDLNGASLDQTDSRMRSVFNTSVEILKDPNVYGVFGIVGQINPDWPLWSNDPQGAKLIENISDRLNVAIDEPILRDNFIRKQRIAEMGYQSICKIFGTELSDTPNMDNLIANLYAWGSDLGLVGPTFRRQ